MSRPTLSFNTRKALSVQLGESAAKELADLFDKLAADVSQLHENKVDVIPIVRTTRPSHDASQSNRRAA